MDDIWFIEKSLCEYSIPFNFFKYTFYFFLKRCFLGECFALGTYCVALYHNSSSGLSSGE